MKRAELSARIVTGTICVIAACFLMLALSQAWSRYRAKTKSVFSNGTYNEDMGYGVLDAGAAIGAIDCYTGGTAITPNPLAGESVIIRHFVWNERMVIRDSIFLDYTDLTIKGAEIKCTPNACIVVGRMSRLVLDGCKFTSSCSGEPWRGIKVLGDSSYNQNATAVEDLGNSIWDTISRQGILELKNGAVIENAICAVEVGQAGNANYGGGIVRASDAHFINNGTAVKFHPFRNTIASTAEEAANKSYFTQCTFKVDSLFAKDDMKFRAHAVLQGVSGISFSGCQFSCEHENPAEIVRQANRQRVETQVL